MKKLGVVALSFLTTIFGFFGSAHSAPRGPLKLAQIVPELHRAAVKITGDELLVAKDVLLATENAKQCQLPIIEIKNTVALLDTSKCAFESSLKIGQEVEVSLLASESVEKTAVVQPTAIAQTAAPQAAPVEGKSTVTPSSNDRIAIKLPENNIEKSICVRRLEDAIQFPCKQGATLRSGLTYAESKYKSAVRTTNTNESRLGLGADYGISSKFALGLSTTYSLNDDVNRESNFSGEKRNFSSSGFSDPWIHSKYKFVDSEKTGHDFAGYLSYSPKLISPKESTLGHQGNEGTGGQAAEISLGYASKFSNYEISTFASYVYQDKRTLESNAIVTGGNAFELSVGIKAQMKNDWFVSSSLSRTQTEDRRNSDPTGFTKYSPYSRTVFGVGVSKLLPKSSAKWYASAGYNTYGDRKITGFDNLSGFPFADKEHDRSGLGIETGINVSL